MRDLDRFLNEDLGRRGDVTTRILFGRRPRTVRARLFTRERIVAAGVSEAGEVFRRLRCKVTRPAVEGRWLRAGGTLLEIQGPIQSVLAGERLALNFLGRMSGIATTTRRLVDRVRRINPRVAVSATRKTTPGFRAYEKRAVVWGGGEAHRAGLFDGILIKDNHLAAFGGVEAAVRRARARSRGHSVEVEVSRLSDAKAAAVAGADWILIDNLSPSEARRLARAARALRPRIRIEVSGGLDETNLVSYARFAHRLSMGRLTHSARSADVSLELRSPKS